MRERDRVRLQRETTDRIEELLRRLIAIQGRDSAMNYLAAKISEVSRSGGQSMK